MDGGGSSGAMIVDDFVDNIARAGNRNGGRYLGTNRQRSFLGKGQAAAFLHNAGVKGMRNGGYRLLAWWLVGYLVSLGKDSFVLATLVGAGWAGLAHYGLAGFWLKR